MIDFDPSVETLQPRTTKNLPNHPVHKAFLHKGGRKPGDRPGYREQPVHITMASMAAVGYNLKEIAQFTGYNYQTVSKILNQPKIVQRVEKIVEKNLQEEIKTFLEAEVLPSLHVIKEIRDDVTTPVGIKKDAAQALIERYLGKPVQQINATAKPAVEMTEAELNAELAKYSSPNGSEPTS